MRDATNSIQIPSNSHESNPPAKKKRSLPGTPDPEAEVIALSPKTLMATNRFLCEICGKGFQRDQNLQLHRRGHNLPWKLKQRSTDARKRVYVCPETRCVHHHASRALGDLTGIKKHFCRKHGEKKWKCDKCSKRYAVHSDWKAHSKTCGTREYKCDCGTIFSRRDSFITHRAFCDALAEETARMTAASHMNNINCNYPFLGPSLISFPSIFNAQNIHPIVQPMPINGNLSYDHQFTNIVPPSNPNYHFNWDFCNKVSFNQIPLTSVPSLFSTQDLSDYQSDPAMSATALLQNAAQMGAKTTPTGPSLILYNRSVQDHGNNLCELYSTSSVTSGHGSHDDVESSVNDHSALNQLQLYSSNCKRRRLQYEEITEGETRDFLGVGINPICHPSSINGWI